MRTEAQKKAQIKYVEANREKVNGISKKWQTKKYATDEKFREAKKQKARERYVITKEKNKKLKELKQNEKTHQAELNRFNNIIIELTEGMDAERKDLFISNLRENGKGEMLDSLGYLE